jgi:hypothetical protein
MLESTVAYTFSCAYSLFSSVGGLPVNCSPQTQNIEYCEAARSSSSINEIFIELRIQHFDRHIYDKSQSEILSFFTFGNLGNEIFKRLVNNLKIRIE